jgi:hypothetical protein
MKCFLKLQTHFPKASTSDNQQENASRQTHAKDTAKLTRKTAQEQNANGNVQNVTKKGKKPAKQIVSGI